MEKIILNKKPNKIKMENGLLRITGIMLSEGKWNNGLYTIEELKKAKIPDVTQKTVKLTKNHGEDIEDDIGVFTRLEKTDKGIEYEAYIDDPDTIRRIKNRMETLKKLGLPVENAFEISSELYADKSYDTKLKAYVLKNITLRRASLVLDGACSPPNCTVNPELNSAKDDVIENATKCERQYMTPDVQRFKKGWEGCMEAMKVCRGLDEKRATAMCNYIFWRRHKDENFNIINLIEEFEKAEDKTKFVEELYSEAIKEFKELTKEFLKDYPWEQCIRDQMKRYGDEEKAKKICGYIKKKYGNSEDKTKYGEDVVRMAEEQIEELFSDFIKEKLGMKYPEELDDNPSEAQEVLNKQGVYEVVETSTGEVTEELKDVKKETLASDDEIVKLKKELEEYKLSLIEELGECECLKDAGLNKEELMNWEIRQLKALVALQRAFKKRFIENTAKRATYHNSEGAIKNNEVSFENIFKI